MTSDDFFSTQTRLLASASPKVIFIDGLHTFEQTLKDCYNSLNCLAEGGVIILHDCSPPTWETAIPALSPNDAKQRWHNERSSRTDNSEWPDIWCGDTWKTIPFLLENHTELNVCTLDTDLGCGVVSRKPGADRIHYQFPSPNDNLTANVNKISMLDFSFLEKSRHEILNLKDMVQLDDVINFHCE